MLKYPEITQDEENAICRQMVKQIRPVADVFWTLHKDVCNIELSSIYWTIWIEMEFPTEPMSDAEQHAFHSKRYDSLVEIVIGPRSFGLAAPLNVWWPLTNRPAEFVTDDGEVWTQYLQYLNEVELEVYRFVRSQVGLYHEIAKACG